MEKKILEALIREETGKGMMKRLRISGELPCVMYGQTQETIHIKVPKASFKKLLVQGISFNEPIELTVKDGKKKISNTVFIKELQHDPVTGEALHVDFYVVEPTQKITLPITINGVGTPAGIEEGGILQQMTTEIMVEGLVADIPRQIDVELSKLNMGDTITVSQLDLPEKLRVIDSEEKVLFHLLSSKKVYLE